MSPTNDELWTWAVEATAHGMVDASRAIQLIAEVERLRSELRDIANSGVELQDPRLGYVLVQIDAELWERLAPYREVQP